MELYLLFQYLKLSLKCYWRSGSYVMRTINTQKIMSSEHSSKREPTAYSIILSCLCSSCRFWIKLTFSSMVVCLCLHTLLSIWTWIFFPFLAMIRIVIFHKLTLYFLTKWRKLIQSPFLWFEAQKILMHPTTDNSNGALLTVVSQVSDWSSSNP
jgi:hypothetical protein